MDRFIRRYLIIVFSLCVSGTFTVLADEGMWPLPWREGTTMEAMKAMGFSLSAQDIYSTRTPSLKDAVVIFDGGCTGGVVSSQGLILTNHHCGYDAIQGLSTVKNDYLTEGYWASSFAEELPAAGVSVTFLVSTEDVTDRLKVLGDSLLLAGSKEGAAKYLTDQRSPGNNYEVEIVPVYENNRKFLFIYQNYLDVRLVGTPPSSIGKFGGETDNWMWPRHTGDFSFFRVYADAKGQPAPYSKDNIPLQTKAYLPLSLKGVRQGDFTFVMGYPGSTSRYIPSFVAENLRDFIHPTRIQVRGVRQRILERSMRKSVALRLQYAAKYVTSANYYKNSQAQMEAFGRLDLVSQKRTYEQELQQWVDADSARIRRYGSLMKDYEAMVIARRPLIRALQYYREALLYSAEYMTLAQSLKPLSEELQKLSAASGEQASLLRKSCDSLAAAWAKEAEKSLAGIDRRTDKRVTQAMLSLFNEQVPREYKPSVYRKDSKLSWGNFRGYTRRVFAQSFLTDERRRQAFINQPSAGVLQNDPLVKLSNAVFADYERLITESGKNRLQMDEYARLFMALLMEKENTRNFYPDANFTMRLTYGMVDGYTVPGGKAWLPFTSLEGVIKKEKRGDEEFAVPSRLKELYQKRDFGPYEENGDVPVCFLSTTDIIGGNSGSPVMNARGELVGIAFDGNWEGALGDLQYDPVLNRTINVDIRYVLFVVDKFAGATRLIEEMKINK